MTAIPHDITDI